MIIEMKISIINNYVIKKIIKLIKDMLLINILSTKLFIIR